MAIFDFIKKRISNQDQGQLTKTEPQVDDTLLQALMAGETITRDKALMLPAVSSAVDLIAGTVASMPIKLYHYKVQTNPDDPTDKKRRVEEVRLDSRVRLLNGSTGDILNAYEMRKAMVEDYLLGKGGYAYVRRNYRNQVDGLYYVKDVEISAFTNIDPIYKTGRFMIGDKYYKEYEVLRILRDTKNGMTGRGLTDEVAKALETAYTTLLYQLKQVMRGGNKRGFLKSDHKLGQQEINALKNSWRRLYSDDSDGSMVLNKGVEFQEASSTAVEMQLDQNKKTLAAEIEKIFHINEKDFDRTFKEAIYPVIKAFEAALNNTLLLESEKLNYFFEFDTKEILRANIKDRFDAYKTAKETGFMTLNEIRQAENMNHIEGLDVINVGLSAVLYDTNTHTYYTPNTDTQTDTKNPESGSQNNTTDENNKKGAENEEA